MGKGEADNVVPFVKLSRTLDEIVAARVKHLSGYQNEALAAKYVALVDKVKAAEARAGTTGLADAVARNYAKLLAYKDEYEVARLHAEAAFQAQLDQTFEDGYRLKFHLAPPLLASRDPATGHLRKMEFGPWLLPLFKGLARLKGLRGTAFDPFGYTAERKRERQLIAEYETLVDELVNGLGTVNHAVAVKLASLPDEIRGYGHIKDANITKAEKRKAELLAQWRNPPVLVRAAE
jgi:indolepyruvate ferredoxin oxidoreductase